MYKRAGLIVLSMMLTVLSFAQDITGLWQGTLYNDTTGQTLKYEIAISGEDSKLHGFSHTWFMIEDAKYYGVKNLKVRREGNKIIVEDDGLLTHNYPVKPAKGVRQLAVLELAETDSTFTLTGPFSTNRSKAYSPLTGYIRVQRKKEYLQSDLVPHLAELGKTKELSFIKEDKQLAQIAVVVNKPQAVKTKEAAPVISQKPVGPAVAVKERTDIIQQTVYFKSDSLHLSLYDNGEIDGDTVSVLMNGQIILARERLGTNAVKKSISTTGQDSIRLVMYAENLGTIAPNSGLLVVRDGKDLYEIRFSGNLSQNAAIIFKKKE